MANCAVSLAPAQCQRQAGLNFKKAQHALKVTQEADAVHARRLQLALRTATRTLPSRSEVGDAKALRTSTLKPAPKPALETETASKRPALTKQVRVSTATRAPLSGRSKPKALPTPDLANAPSETNPALGLGVSTPARSAKPRLLEQLTPTAKAQARPLLQQPSALERSANRVQASAKQQIASARLAKTQDKKAKRLAKDRARQAAGFVVDKP